MISLRDTSTSITRNAVGRRAPDADRPDGVRVALYSHDTMGLGHLRRNLLIAHTLAEPPLEATNLLITGAHEANFFRLPDRADCFTLPRLHKNGLGDYASGPLAMALEDLTQLRARAICCALDVFQPDLFIVDKVPTGAFGELLPVLELLSNRGGTKCVLGIRDVLDDAATVAREWLHAENLAAIDRYYDAVWVYGDAQVYDPVVEYRLPTSIAQRLTFTGYIDQSARVSGAGGETAEFIESIEPGKRLIVCMVGGGQDGAAIARTFIEALPTHGVIGVVVTGPFMPAAEMAGLTALAALKDNVLLVDFVPEADLLIERADRVVAMAGYNTVCSLLSFRKTSLLVPRVAPRAEQRIRAERLRDLGLIDMMLPEDLTVRALARWIAADHPRAPDARQLLDLNGLTRLTQLTQELLPRGSARRRAHFASPRD